MLSPCIRQVTHALLTRPPLTFKSLGFIKSPFDLHVLSTPPAFILSQDQTLMLWFVPVKINFLANFSLFTVLGCLFRLFVLKFFRIFRVVILFSYQCSFVICFNTQISLYILPNFHLLVKHFFKLFFIFKKLNGEGGI